MPRGSTLAAGELGISELDEAPRDVNFLSLYFLSIYKRRFLTAFSRLSLPPEYAHGVRWPLSLRFIGIPCILSAIFSFLIYIKILT